MISAPITYFLTFTTYGSWLHGRNAGSVDRDHNHFGEEFLVADARMEHAERGRMAQPVYDLDLERRNVVLETIQEVAQYRGWRLWAVHVRSNHFHLVVSASAAPEKAMADFKAYASRRLCECFQEPAARKRWTEHGSTRYLWREDNVREAIDYVLNRQGSPMAVYDGAEEQDDPSQPSEPEA